jgi:hypothetical protein
MHCTALSNTSNSTLATDTGSSSTYSLSSEASCSLSSCPVPLLPPCRLTLKVESDTCSHHKTLFLNMVYRLRSTAHSVRQCSLIAPGTPHAVQQLCWLQQLQLLVGGSRPGEVSRHFLKDKCNQRRACWPVEAYFADQALDQAGWPSPTACRPDCLRH